MQNKKIVCGGAIILFILFQLVASFDSIAQSYCSDPVAYIQKLKVEVQQNKKTERVFDFVEISPKPKQSFQDYLNLLDEKIPQSNLVPKKYRFEFIIEKNGNLSNIHCDLKDEISQKILDFLKLDKTWESGKIANVNVRTKTKLYISK